MIPRFFRIGIDAVGMVKKNIKIYALLSVTLILTFSSMGIFVFFTDSYYFLKNKDYIKVSPNVSVIEYYDGSNENVTNFCSQLRKMKDTNSCTTMEVVLQDDANQIIEGDIYVKADIHAVYGQKLWAYYYNNDSGVFDVNRMQTLQGEKSIRVRRLKFISQRKSTPLI